MKTQKLNLKKIAIIVGIILLIAIIFLVANQFKNKTLNLNPFEKLAVYGYLENITLEPTKLYQLYGNTDFDELQVFQVILKETLDAYFKTTMTLEVPSSTILSTINPEVTPANLDLNGVIISDYTYNSHNDTFVKEPGANSKMQIMEQKINTGLTFSNAISSINTITKTSDGKYKINFDILENGSKQSVLNTCEAVLVVQYDTIIIESCNLNLTVPENK